MERNHLTVAKVTRNSAEFLLHVQKGLLFPEVVVVVILFQKHRSGLFVRYKVERLPRRYSIKGILVYGLLSGSVVGSTALSYQFYYLKIFECLSRRSNLRMCKCWRGVYSPDCCVCEAM